MSPFTNETGGLASMNVTQSHSEIVDPAGRAKRSFSCRFAPSTGERSALTLLD